MPIADLTEIKVGSRVAYEDMANPRRVGRVVSLADDGSAGVAWEERSQFPVEGSDDPIVGTVSDLRQHGWNLLPDEEPFAAESVDPDGTVRDGLGNAVGIDQPAAAEAFGAERVEVPLAALEGATVRGVEVVDGASEDSCYVVVTFTNGMSLYAGDGPTAYGPKAAV